MNLSVVRFQLSAIAVRHDTQLRCPLCHTVSTLRLLREETSEQVNSVRSSYFISKIKDQISVSGQLLYFALKISKWHISSEYSIIVKSLIRSSRGEMQKRRWKGSRRSWTSSQKSKKNWRIGRRRWIERIERNWLSIWISSPIAIMWSEPNNLQWKISISDVEDVEIGFINLIVNNCIRRFANLDNKDIYWSLSEPLVKWWNCSLW